MYVMLSFSIDRWIDRSIPSWFGKITTVVEYGRYGIRDYFLFFYATEVGF